ncbi:MAG: YvcK family protein [Candidatus Moraniibacteriota bacterium]|nr:MAG: YvcK family protein [Candidatus Moranbacteria bacterium]
MKVRKIVTLGGGTGSYTLLLGLKKYPSDLTAIVSMADDGGSTGVLRDELGVLPPGDVRQCLVALSQSSGKMRELMNYRFSEGGLKGHNFGNLFLSALEKINGSFGKGIEDAMKILNVSGEVIPVTDHDAKLRLELGDGTILEGENAINHSDIQEKGVKKIWYESRVGAYPKALIQVDQADVIIIGPGNHYCSILPSVVIKPFARAIRESRAKVIYVCNLTNKKGHTSGWGVAHYVDSLEKYIGKGRINYVIVNTEKPKKELIEKYERKEGKGTLVDYKKDEEANKRSYKIVLSRVISESIPEMQIGDTIASLRAFIRHDSDKLAKVIMLLLEMEDQKVIEDVI